MPTINTDVWGEKSTWAVLENGSGNRDYRGVSDDDVAADLEKYPLPLVGLNGGGNLYDFSRSAEHGSYFTNPTDCIDRSIAYVGIQGANLPQNNVYWFNYNHNTKSNYLAKLNLTNECVPFALAQMWDTSENINLHPNIYGYGGRLQGFDKWTTQIGTINQNNLRWSPRPSTGTPITGNLNDITTPIITFGVKSFILEIHVQTIDELSSVAGVVDSSTHDYTLKEFAELSQEEIDNIYIKSIYVVPYQRTGKNKYYQAFNQRQLFPLYLSNIAFKDFEINNFYNHTIDFYNGIPRFTVFGHHLGGVTLENRTSTGNYEDGRNASRSTTFFLPKEWDIHTFDQSTNFIRIYSYLKKENDNYLKQNIINMARKGVAAFGMFFVDDISDFDLNNFTDDDFLDDKMYVGLIDENGLTHGDYTHGADNANTKTWTLKSTDNNNFNPEVPHPPKPTNEYSNSTSRNTVGNIESLCKRYVLNANAVQNLGKALWTITNDFTEQGTDYEYFESKSIDNFLTTNPIDCIISLQKFPLSLPIGETAENIPFGKTESTVQGYPLNSMLYEINYKKLKIAPAFDNSFLDYEPYTQFELYVPFCGTTKIEPAEILNRDLSVSVVIDFSTGTALGYVYSDDLLIKTLNGNIAVQLPVTGAETATTTANIANAIATYKNADRKQDYGILKTLSIGGMISAVSNPAATIENFSQNQHNKAFAGYELQHIPMPTKNIGSASAIGLWVVDLNCRLYCYYPTGDVINSDKTPPEFVKAKLTEYGHITGFTKIDTALLSDYSDPNARGANLVKCSDINLDGISATDTEKELIKAALAEGCYI